MLLKKQEKFTKRINKTKKHKTIEIGMNVFAKVSKFKTHKKLNLPISGPLM